MRYKFKCNGCDSTLLTPICRVNHKAHECPKCNKNVELEILEITIQKFRDSDWIGIYGSLNQTS